MEAGAVVGQKYRLVRRIGKGGMGSVWEAVHVASGAPVAIKLLLAEAASGDDHRERLVREARAAATIHHPNVVEFFDAGLTDEGEPYLVLELLRGQTLRLLMRNRGQLDEPTALWIAAEVARALEAAHEAGIAHRDLKPSNVFLHQAGPDGVVVKVLDFGVSKFLSEEHATMTSTGAAIGSPAYMSPEQAKGERIDRRTDLWSLGVLLFEMMAARRPFHAENSVALLSAILFGETPRLSDFLPEIDRELDDIVARCLERRLEARFQTAAELLFALEARSAALATAASRGRRDLGAWVEAPNAAVPESAAPWEGSGLGSVAGASQSGTLPTAPSGSGSGTGGSAAYGVAAGVGSVTHTRAAPRMPVAAVVIPGLAFLGLLVALAVLVVRSLGAERQVEQTDVVGVPAPPASVVAPPPEAPPPAMPPIVAVSSADAAAPARSVAPPVPKPPAPVAAPKPAVTAPKPPAATPKPACKSPIVDGAGKVIGCLD